MGVIAATHSFAPKPGEFPTVYRARNPRVTPLYQLLESHFDTVKALWEERRYGFWKGFYESAVHKYFDCGLFESGYVVTH